jgi:hypothetical protein
VATGMQICMWALLVILAKFISFYLPILKYILSDFNEGKRDKDKANSGENIPQKMGKVTFKFHN